MPNTVLHWRKLPPDVRRHRRNRHFFPVCGQLCGEGCTADTNQLFFNRFQLLENEFESLRPDHFDESVRFNGRFFCACDGRAAWPSQRARNGLKRRSLAAVVNGPWPGAISVSSASRSRIRRECVSCR